MSPENLIRMMQAEVLNGRLAMLAIVVLVGTYLTTGELLPGVL